MPAECRIGKKYATNELDERTCCASDGKYRYNEVSISIDTSGIVIDKYQYFRDSYR